MKGDPIKSNSVEESWICKECGALNAPWLDKCGRCKTFQKKSQK